MKLSAISRINAFDLLRGWCLVVISSDHLGRFPSLFDPVTGRGLLWVSAAEGFFFISGTLVGLVRGRKMHAGGLMAATKDLWKRAGKLYLASVILTLIFTGLAYWVGEGGAKGGVGHFGSIWELVMRTATLQYSYGWTDFLNYYVVFLLLSPGVLWLCRHGLWWLVLAASLSLWVGKHWLGGGDIVTAYLTWQSYFFFGLIFGYHYNEIHAWYRRLAENVRSNGRAVMYGLTAITVVASFAVTFGTPVFDGRVAVLADFFRGIKDNPVFTMLLQENRTGWLRLGMFLLWFGTVFALVRRYEEAIMMRVGWLLLPLGKNSLYVYILQGAVVFGVVLLNIPGNFIINTLINLTAVMIYWVAVRKRFLFAVIPR